MTGLSSVAAREELLASASPGLPRLLVTLIAAPIGKLARATPGHGA